MTSTLITFLLDRSGSMQNIRQSTIDAFNTYLAGLKEGTPDNIDFTLLQFDSQGMDKCCVSTPIGQVQNLSTETFVPRASTPLIDACYKTIKAVENAILELAAQPKIVVCIQTDGYENASTEYTWEELKKLIKARTEEGWQFNFMGAGIDAYEQGARMGVAVADTVSYNSADDVETAQAFAASASNARLFASGARANTSYTVNQKFAAGEHKVVGNSPPITPAVAWGAPVTPQKSKSVLGHLDLGTRGANAHPRPKTIPDFTL